MQSDPAKDSQLRRHVFRNTLSNYAGKFFILGVWFFLTPFLVHRLGSQIYGLWVLVGSVVAYGNLFDLGIASAVAKYVAEYHAQGKIGEAKSLVATALWLYLALGLAVIGLSIVLAPFFPTLFHLSPEQQSTATWLVLLSGIALGLNLPCSVSIAVLRGLQRFDLMNLIGVLGTSLTAAATVGCVVAGWGVIGMAVANVLLTLIMQIPALYLIHRTAPALQFGWRGASRRLVKTVAKFSSALFIINVAGQLQTKTDEIVVGAVLPIANVTPYSIARRLSELPQMLTDQFMKVLMPLASQLHAEHDRERLRALYLSSTRLTLVIFAPIACGLLILARPFLAAWVGAAYADSAYLVVILTCASLIETSQWPAAAILQGTAKHQRLAVFSIGSALANLGLSILLAHYIGLAGVALGTLIPNAIEGLFFVLPYALRANGLSARTVVAEAFLPAMVPALPMAAAIYALNMLLAPNSLVTIALIAGAGLIVYLAVYWVFSASPAERQVGRSVALGTMDRLRTGLKRMTLSLPKR